MLLRTLVYQPDLQLWKASGLNRSHRSHQIFCLLVFLHLKDYRLGIVAHNKLAEWMKLTINCILRVLISLQFCSFPNESGVISESNNRWCNSVALMVCNYFNAAVLVNSNAWVHCSQIDPNRKRHFVCWRLSWTRNTWQRKFSSSNDLQTLFFITANPISAIVSERLKPQTDKLVMCKISRYIWLDFINNFLDNKYSIRNESAIGEPKVMSRVIERSKLLI